MAALRIQQRIRQTFTSLHGRDRRIQIDLEHGQWWVTRLDDGAQWSVVEASGPGSWDGFAFELVTQGDD